MTADVSTTLSAVWKWRIAYMLFNVGIVTKDMLWQALEYADPAGDISDDLYLVLHPETKMAPDVADCTLIDDVSVRYDETVPKNAVDLYRLSMTYKAPEWEGVYVD